MRLCGLLLALAFVAVDAHAHRPAPARAFSNGLEPGTEIGGVAVLQVPASGRVFIPGGKFNMGAGSYELALASALCQRESLGIRCRPTLVLRGLVLAAPRKEESAQYPDFLRYELPLHSVTISAFHIDRTEVTVDAYRRCASAGKCAAPGFPTLDSRFDNPTFPVTHVSWFDAVEYCKFAGGRLPTEAEWEFAARGEAARAFPWGNVYNPHLCNHGSFALDPTDASDGYQGLAPVGSFKNGATPLGVLDMAGNVSEWVLDQTDIQQTTTGAPIDFPSYDPSPATNPVVTHGAYRVHRGGSYSDGAHEMRATTRSPPWPRSFLQPVLRTADIGFRCVYALGGK